MRSLIIRSLQALVSISAVVVLTGANDAGCGFGSSGSGGDGGTGGTGGSAGGDPGLECPEGTVVQWVCGGGERPSPDMGSGASEGWDGHPPPPPPGDGMTPPPPPPGGEPPHPGDHGCQPPPPDDCVQQCVPVVEECPAGSHLETRCDGPPPPPPPADDAGAPVPGDGMTPPPPPDGMGYSEPAYPGDPGTCVTTCVPDDVCPPGTVQQTVCTGGEAPSMDPADPMAPPPPPDGQCWNECVPVGSMCPPGSHEEVNCPPDGYGAPCEIICAPDQPN